MFRVDGFKYYELYVGHPLSLLRIVSLMEYYEFAPGLHLKAFFSRRAVPVAPQFFPENNRLKRCRRRPFNLEHCTIPVESLLDKMHLRK